MNILIVEDESDIRRLLSLHLKKDNYTVFEASNGLEGLNLFLKEEIHLVVLDIMMPVMDGLSLIEKLREKSTVPIICLTALGTDSDKILALGLGSDDYLVKPVNPLELVARVSSQLRRCYKYSSNIESNLFVNGPLKVIPEKFEVYINNKAIVLNGKEFKILDLFIKNIGRVFTKKQIYENVWDDIYLGDDNTLLVHLSHLKNKIEENPKEPKFIRTIRGVGYKMERISQ